MWGAGKKLMVTVALLSVLAVAGSERALAAPAEALVNGGFESGIAPWIGFSNQSGRALVTNVAPATGALSADLCNRDRCFDSLYQRVRVPADMAKARLRARVRIDSTEPALTCEDEVFLGIFPTDGTELIGTELCAKQQPNGTWTTVDLDASTALRDYRGSDVDVAAFGFTDRQRLSHMWVDDVSLTFEGATAPSAAQDVRALVTGPGSVTVTWTAPASASPAAHYEVTPSAGGLAVTVPVDARTATFSGLSTSQPVTFSVVAANEVGDAPPAVSNAVVADGDPLVRLARSDRQYQYPSSIEWAPIDPTNLVASVTPTTAGTTAVIDGNVDLWTATAGVNQDIGIAMRSSQGDNVVLAWKESGGFAGTFSPNAAAVHTTLPLLKDVTYDFTLVWKANRKVQGSTIFAGAGPIGQSFSPTTLRVRTKPTTGVTAAVSTSQRSLASSNGSSWVPLHQDTLTTVTTPASAGVLTFTGNADLWTENAGVNQDLGIRVTSSDGQHTNEIVGWKESGGFAGTFSPNAALVTGRLAAVAGVTYTAELVWKANAPALGKVIHAAAGDPGAFSPSTLTAVLDAAPQPSSVLTTQPPLTDSDGATWTPVAGATPITASPSVASLALLTANADLWTQTSGFNQDLGIEMLVNGTSRGIVAWKESGGFAGTFSPNAASVQTAVPIEGGSTTTFRLVWKTNRPAPGATIRIGAGGPPGGYSPTRLDAVVVAA